LHQYSFDVGAAYTWNNYNFDLMMTNLGDVPFYITRDQAPRSYRFSVTTQF
jgi:hypothetical protein